MKEYKLPLDSFIGGWFLPTKVCDELVSYYNEFNKHATPGKSGGGKIRKNIKDSLDLSINSKRPFLILSPQYFCGIDMKVP